MHQHRLEKKTVSTEELKQLPNYCKENVNETDYYYQNGLYEQNVELNFNSSDTVLDHRFNNLL